MHRLFLQSTTTAFSSRVAPVQRGKPHPFQVQIYDIYDLNTRHHGNGPERGQPEYVVGEVAVSAALIWYAVSLKELSNVVWIEY